MHQTAPSTTNATPQTMTNTTTRTTTMNGSLSVLATLRSLIPERALSFEETLRITERQATKLLELHQATTAPVPSEIITELPRVRVRLDSDMPVSGSSGWNGRDWIISLNAHDSWARRRFTLAHEYLHIVHHGLTQYLYSDNPAIAAAQAEQVADYFAGCLLIPKRLLKSTWCGGLQNPRDLARHFGVSRAAIHVRLDQTGLTMPSARCEIRTTRGRARYHAHPTTTVQGGR